MIKKIIQKHRTGCAIASLAMLLGISYDEAIKILHPNHKPYQKLVSNLEQITSALNRLKINVRYYSNIAQQLALTKDKETDIKSLKNPALLCVYLRDLYGANHVAVWDPSVQKVLDPGRKRNMPVSFYQRRLSFVIELQ